jgi:hypothetical protein
VDSGTECAQNTEHVKHEDDVRIKLEESIWPLLTLFSPTIKYETRAAVFKGEQGITKHACSLLLIRTVGL